MIHIDSHWGNESNEYYDPSFYDAYDDENSCGYYTSNKIGEDKASYTVNKKCKYCGKTGLEWIKTARGWRLGEYSGAIHNCLDKPLRPKENIDPPKRSASIYTLLSNAIQGNHLSIFESKEWDKLEAFFKNNQMTIEDLFKKINS